MKAYNIMDIKRRVRSIIDQNMEDGQLSANMDVDTLELDDVIQENIVPGIRMVEIGAAFMLLGNGKDFSEGLVGRTDPHVDDCMVFNLPKDYLRLVYFCMSSWRVGVSRTISVQDPRYAMQRGTVGMARGCAERPVVAEAYSKEGLTLEAYGCNSDDTVLVAQYIPEPAITESDQVEFPHRLEEASLYAIAALTCTSFGDVGRAQIFMATARQLGSIHIDSSEQVEQNNTSDQ